MSPFLVFIIDEASFAVSLFTVLYILIRKCLPKCYQTRALIVPNSIWQGHNLHLGHGVLDIEVDLIELRDQLSSHRCRLLDHTLMDISFVEQGRLCIELQRRFAKTRNWDANSKVKRKWLVG